MEKTKAEKLLEFLRQKEKEEANELNLLEILTAAQEIKIDKDENFINRFARAALFMALGINHEKIEFAKEKFYQRVGGYCRRAVKVAAIVKKVNAGQ